jgi:hypothetical protein
MEQQQIHDFLIDNPELHRQFIQNLDNEIQKSQIALKYVKTKFQKGKKTECDDIIELYKSIIKSDFNLKKNKLKKMKLQIINEQNKLKHVLNELNKIIYETEKRKKIIIDELLKREMILFNSTFDIFSKLNIY